VSLLDLEAAAAKAHALIDFADGLEDAGLAQTARRSRVVARLTLELVDELSAERSARRAMQTNYERCLSVLERRTVKAETSSVGPKRNPLGDFEEQA
jgi:thiamine monophosphate kinase